MRFSSALLASTLVLLASRADSQVLRFSATAPGRVIGIGNTLGLSKAPLSENGPGDRDSIGTFIALGNSVDDFPANPGNPWPVGTTNDWTQNGSTAVLTLPVEAEVLYAELVWGGSTNYAPEDVRTLLETPVLLSSGSASTSVVPAPATALTIAETSATGFAANYYMRSADVTAFVQQGGSGTYSVSGVPATQTTTINSLNAAGWTLVVALRDSSEIVRNLSVFVGGSFVDENSQQDYTISGFCTPPSGLVEGRVIVSAIEGDANLVGDTLLIAPTSADTFEPIDGPNNPVNNFFCSQINGDDGLVDVQGSFGGTNHDAQLGSNVDGGRQGWDVTSVALSSQAGQLQNAQTSAVLRTITTGDSYVPIAAALAIDVNAPDFTASGTALETSVAAVAIGDTFQVTADLSNGGQVTADNVVLKLPLESGLSLLSFEMNGQSGDINGNPVTKATLASGVDVGDLAGGAARHVVMELEVVGPPTASAYVLRSEWRYAFELCAGGTTQTEFYVQQATVGFDSGSGSGGSGGGGGGGGAGAAGGAGGSAGGATTTTAVATSSGAGGDGTASSGNGGNGETGGSPSVVEEGGCGCAVPGSEKATWPGALALAAAATAALRRRRRYIIL